MWNAWAENQMVKRQFLRQMELSLQEGTIYNLALSDSLKNERHTLLEHSPASLNTTICPGSCTHSFTAHILFTDMETSLSNIRLLLSTGLHRQISSLVIIGCPLLLHRSPPMNVYFSNANEQLILTRPSLAQCACTFCGAEQLQCRSPMGANILLDAIFLLTVITLSGSQDLEAGGQQYCVLAVSSQLEYSPEAAQLSRLHMINQMLQANSNTRRLSVVTQAQRRHYRQPQGF